MLLNIYNHNYGETHFIFSIFVSMSRPKSETATRGVLKEKVVLRNFTKFTGKRRHVTKNFSGQRRFLKIRTL